MSEELFFGAEDRVEESIKRRLKQRREQLGWNRPEAVHRLTKLGHGSFLGSRQLIEKIETPGRRVRAAELLLYMQVLKLTKQEKCDFIFGHGVPRENVEIQGATARAESPAAELPHDLRPST